MKKMCQPVFAFFMLLCAFGLMSCNKSHNEPGNVSTPAPVVISGNGDIAPKVEAFRKLLGDPLNSTTGKTTGRREINWDGVPDEFMTTKLPDNFFNAAGANDPESRKRGFVYESNGEFRVSNAGFSNVEPTLSTQLTAFSGDKIFANTSSSLWDATFMVAGEEKPAAVNGFGAVFSDVDLADVSSLEFFSGDKSLGKYFVQPHNEASGLSFLGVYFKDATVTKVKIAHGNGIIAAGQKDITNGGSKYIVAMDDFFYNEPAPHQ